MKKIEADGATVRKSTAGIARDVAESLGIDRFALNYYELAPEESFAAGLHTHFDQEEVFAVLKGMITFETDDGPVPVAEGEVVRFEPGEFHRGVNEAEEDAVSLAIGAPKETEDTSIECPGCGSRAPPKIYPSDDGEARIFECKECGSEIDRQT